ncbi:ABC transporter substrate-binding protein [Methyloglobulus sp.]|uniref:ABC transporter substrate-binding protein n=1 Tax=Methyloglobulus sp. TaxID=2518622 RepID=UPI003989C18F
MNKKTIVAILMALVIALFVVYVRIGPPPVVKTVRVITPPAIIASLPVWIAEEKGMFLNRGLNIQLVDLTNSQLMVEAMLAGNVDVLPAVSLADLVNTGGTGNIALLQVKIFSHSRMKKIPPFESILTSTGNAIGNIKELEGRRIAVYPGMTSELAVKYFLRSSGVNQENIRYIKLPPPEHEPALLRGDVDAIHVYEPFRTLSLQNGKARELAGSVYATLNEPSGIGCSAISRNFYRDKTDAAEKFLDAWNEAIDFIRDNPAEARKVLSQRLGLPETVAASATWVDATKTDETSYQILSDTVSSAKSAGIIPDGFYFEKDMVLHR